MVSKAPILSERLELGAGFRRAFSTSLFIGGGALAAAVLVSFLSDRTFKHFYFAYLTSFMFFLSISLGGLFFVLIQHVTRAGWSVAVRRIPETLACMMPMLLVLSAPIVVSVLEQQGKLYPWARPIEGEAGYVASHAEASSAETPAADLHEGSAALDELIHVKRPYLNWPFFIARIAVYFAVWSAAGLWYWKRSVEQDSSGDAAITARMQAWAPAAIIAFGVTLTFASFDLLMSLDPAWFSTIFGVYYFSGCAISVLAVTIICLYILQRCGYLTRAITIEHYHDLGKLLFAFTFFWGYIAFSQYMLLWYANIPEETAWFVRRGATTVDAGINGWTIVCLMLLFGQLLIPFAGLLSRHVKRSKKLLVFWSVWLLVFHWMDMLWLVMPEMDGGFHLGLVEILCLIGIGGIFVAVMLRVALGHELRPIADPRLPESFSFENI